MSDKIQLRTGKKGAAGARSGDGRSGNAPRARGQKSDKRLATPVASGVARRGASLPLDATNKKGKGARR